MRSFLVFCILVLWLHFASASGGEKVWNSKDRKINTPRKGALREKKLEPLGVLDAMVPAVQIRSSETVSGSANIPLRVDSVSNSARVFCYWGSWRPAVLSYFSTNLCTHVVYSFISIGNDGTASADLQSFAALKSRDPNVKLLIAAGGWNDQPEKYSLIAADANKRAFFANSVFNLITQYNLDGFDLDWEYPVEREGRVINSADKTNIILLLQNLRSTFSSKPGLILSVAVAACEYQASKSYDVAQMSQNVDFINLMTYDLHGSWEAKTGLHSALFSDPASVETCANYWINSGAQKSKLILGIPAYGRTWKLTDSTQNFVGAATNGPGNAGPITQEAGILAYHEICANNWQRVFATAQQVPYAFSGNQWVGYEDTQSVAVKANYVKTNGFGGAMFWSLDIDDFSNFCGGGNFPLIKTAYNILVGAIPQTSAPTNSPTTKAPTTTKLTTKAPTTKLTTKAPTTTKLTTKAPTTKLTTKAPTTKAPATTQASGIFVCPGDGLYKDPASCYGFYSCSNGIAFYQFCPSTLCFNPNLKVCDWCFNVAGC